MPKLRPEEIPTKDINIQAAIAPCQNCHAVFAFEAEVGASHGGSSSMAKQHVETPNRFELDQSGANLLMIHRWLSQSCHEELPNGSVRAGDLDPSPVTTQ